jgi:hypothetical protein
MIILQTVGLLGRVINSSQGLYLNAGWHKHRINEYTHQTSMPWVGFVATIPESERVKTVHALDRSATVTGTTTCTNTTIIIVNIGLRVRTRHVRDSSVFSVCTSVKHCPFARCAHAANVGVNTAIYLNSDQFLWTSFINTSIGFFLPSYPWHFYTF